VRRRALLLVLAALITGAPAAHAQSTHLLALESAAPATTPDAVSALARRGWAGLWVNPAADLRATGALAGLERNAFGGVRTLLALAAFRAGPRWSVSLAQSTVSDLFDPDLIAQDPTLNDLRATALSAGADAAVGLGRGLAVSAGFRLDRDELLGVSRHEWIARMGTVAELPLGVRLGGTLERAAGGNAGTMGLGRMRAGLARSWTRGALVATLGAGAEAGGVWRATRDSRAASGSFAVELARTVTLGGSLGRERDLYSAGGWVGRSAFWVGVAVSRVSVQLRVASQPGEAGSALAVAAALTR
jgi:hypothetical protein